MIGWNIKVHKVDGSVETYAVNPKVIVAFERHFKVGLAGAFTNEQKMEHLYWLAWEAERASGKLVKLFDDYLMTIVNVEVETVSPTDGTL